MTDKQLREMFGAALKEERERSGLTLRQLAAKLGTDNSTISKWESGVNAISGVDLYRYCEAVGISFKDFCKKLD